MKIVTIQDANEVNCCTCDWPTCAAPRQECESKSGNFHWSGFAPYVQPAGADTDPLPTLYTTFEQPILAHDSGTSAIYDGWSFFAFGPPDYYEALHFLTLDRDYPIIGGLVENSSLVVTGNTAPDNTFSPATPITGSTTTPYGSNYIFIFGTPYSIYGASTDTVTDTYTKTDDLFKRVTDTHWTTGGSAPTLQGAGGSASLWIHFVDIHHIAEQRWLLSDPVTFTDALTEAEDAADAEEWASGACYSRLAVDDWPLIGDPDFDSLTLDADGFVTGYGPNWFNRSGYIYVTMSRYRMGVPTGYSTVEVPRSTWEMTWDEVFASYAWWEWYDGGMEGDEPDDSIALVTARDWTWGGSMDFPWSDWYEIPVPTEPGETRVVNVMVTCWRSTRLGYKPTAHGDQVALP